MPFPRIFAPIGTIIDLVGIWAHFTFTDPPKPVECRRCSKSFVDGNGDLAISLSPLPSSLSLTPTTIPNLPAQGTQPSTKPQQRDVYYGHESTAKMAAAFIAFHYGCPQSPPPTTNLTSSGRHPRLAHFVAYALHRTRLDSRVMFTALFLLERLKTRFPAARGSSGHRLFLSAFMIASKVVCDDTYSNKSWAIVGQGMFQLKEINTMEHEMCGYLEWNLYTDHQELEQFAKKTQLEFGSGVVNRPQPQPVPLTSLQAHGRVSPPNKPFCHRERFQTSEPDRNSNMSSSSPGTPMSPQPASNAPPASTSTGIPQAGDSHATVAAKAAKVASVVESLPGIAFSAATGGFAMVLCSPKGDIALTSCYTSLFVPATIAAGVAKFYLVDNVGANPARLAVARTYVAIALTCMFVGSGIMLYTVAFVGDGTLTATKGSSVAQRSAGAFSAAMACALIFGGLAFPALSKEARSAA